MAKMLLKDFTALACGIICAILCFSILLHYHFIKPVESAAKYQIENKRMLNNSRSFDRN